MSSAGNLEDRLVFETRAKIQGFQSVAGLDEAGRGPQAGPVGAACVVLGPILDCFSDVDDSNKLPPKKRSELYDLIRREAAHVGVGIVDAATIDRINILQATFLAMQQALAQITQPPEYLLIDGNQRPRWAVHAETIVSGDSRSLSIAAASIIAKVTRDRIMEAYDREYPRWGFAQHKGYGTAQHMEALRLYGPCPIHRQSFFPISQLSLGLDAPLPAAEDDE